MNQRNNRRNKMNSSGKSITKIMGSVFVVLLISILITAGAAACDKNTKSAEDSATSCGALADYDKECTSCDCESVADCEQAKCDCELCGCVSIVDDGQDNSKQESSEDLANCNGDKCDS